MSPGAAAPAAQRLERSLLAAGWGAGTQGWQMAELNFRPLQLSSRHIDKTVKLVHRGGHHATPSAFPTSTGSSARAIREGNCF